MKRHRPVACCRNANNSSKVGRAVPCPPDTGGNSAAKGLAALPKGAGVDPGNTWSSGDDAGKVHAAFTLIELLVVTAILGVLVAVIGACLSSGIRVWEVAATFNKDEADAIFGLHLVKRDLANSIRFAPIGFTGTETGMEFSSLVTGAPGMDDDATGVGTVKYVFDPARAALLRMAWPYPEEEPLTHAAAGVEALLTDVEDASFWYGVLSTGDMETVFWTDETTNFPERVRLRISLAGRADPVEFERLVVLPLGGEE